MIKFKSIEYKNIMSVGNNAIRVELDKYNKTLVTGTNGAGKSTFVEALCFGLYGKPFRPIKKPQLVNAVNKKNLLVEVEFQDSKHTYKIIRGVKPNKFEIHKDGELIPQEAAVADYQDMLEKNILKMNMSTFKQIAVLGTAGYTPFMLLPAGKRREIIEDLLDIGIFTIMSDLNKVQVKQLRGDIAKMESDIENRMNEIRLHVEYQKENKAAVEGDLDKFQQRLDELNATRAELEKTIEASAALLEKQSAELAAHESKVEEAIRSIRDTYVKLNAEVKQAHEEAISQLESDRDYKVASLKEVQFDELNDLDNSRDGVLKSIQSAQQKALSEFDADYDSGLPPTVSSDDISDMKSEIAVNRTELSKLEENKGFYDHTVECPTCKQSISEDFAKKVIAMAEEAIAELKAKTVEVVKSLKEANEANEAHAEYVANGKKARRALIDEQSNEYATKSTELSEERSKMVIEHTNANHELDSEWSTKISDERATFRDRQNELSLEETTQTSEITEQNNDRRQALSDAVVNTKAELDSAKKEQTSVSTQIGTVTTDIAELKKRAESEDRSELINELSGELRDVKKEHNSNLSDMHCRGVISGLLKDSGIKTLIIQQYIPLINKYINDYLKLMGANYNFVLDGEFNETIKSRGRDDFSYTSFSQGERCRIDLALLFSFRDLVSARTGSMTNLMVMDEVFDSAADSDGVDSINAILSTLDDNVFIISHNEKHEQSMFDKHIRFVKKGNFTREV